MLFKPTVWLESVLRIDKDLLHKYAIEGLLLDLDNTLSMHDSPAAERGVFEWLSEMRGLGVRMAVVSNNTEKRVKPLAEELGVAFVAFGCKPLPFGLRKGVRLLQLPKSRVALVGDQIFTDVAGGNLYGIKTILVEPFYLESKPSFRLKRKIESVVFKRDFSKSEKK
ncbi:MAG: YqeG family HAD IIIA-type phosphatase [Oscillospiraceae bacterium]|jgi:HAD superfamily phosphatase (TIGR01668 family)|nr:YqeG family HAD IIIA-type phosphatase [Oscillospiraceae bacterium]